MHVKYFGNLCFLARLAELSGPVFAVFWSLACNFHCGLERVSVKRYPRPWISGPTPAHTDKCQQLRCFPRVPMLQTPHTMQPAGSLCFSQNTHSGVPLLLGNTPAPSSLVVTARNRECVFQPLIYSQLTHTTGQMLHLK